MAHTFDLTSQRLAELRRPRPYPAITVSLPTHPVRRAPGSDQDAIRLRNLVAEAKKQLARDPDVSRDTRIDVEARLDAAAAEFDENRFTDGAVLLAAPGEHQVWNLPTAVPEQVVVAYTFLTRGLVASWLQERPYWVLVFSLEGTRLWHGAGEHLSEHDRDGFPALPEIPDRRDAQLTSRFDNRPRDYRDERIKQYLKQVDDVLFPLMQTSPAPVFPVGEKAVLDQFAGLSRCADLLVERTPRAGADKLTHAEMAEVMRPARAAYADRRQRETLERLEESRGQQRFAGGVDDVWKALTEGRAETVAVELGYRLPGTVRDGRLEPQDGAADGEVTDDIVDTVVERALDTDAEVVFVADGELDGHGRTAAVLRY